MKKVLFCLIIGLFYGCSHKVIKSYPIDIFGTWHLTSNDFNYPEIIFDSDSLAIFQSRFDTVYRFKYFVKNNYLNVSAYNTQTTGKYEILKLDNDSLIFRTLVDKESTQRYYKHKAD